MFERFTDPARQVVVLAQEEARRFGHGWLGTEHLLLGLLREGTGAGWRVLDMLGVELEDVRAWLGREIGEAPAGFEPTDSDALRTIGIDLDEVRRAAEEAFGPGALERAARRRRIRRRGIRVAFGDRACSGPLPAGAHVPFTPRSKKVLELSLREAVRLGHRHVGTEHILLGLAREGEGLAATYLVARDRRSPATSGAAGLPSCSDRPSSR